MSPLEILDERNAVFCENHTKNTRTHSVGRKEISSALNQVVHVDPLGIKGF
jgi:hypothetical protein